MAPLRLRVREQPHPQKPRWLGNVAAARRGDDGGANVDGVAATGRAVPRGRAAPPVPPLAYPPPQSPPGGQLTSDTAAAPSVDVTSQGALAMWGAPGRQSPPFHQRRADPIAAPAATCVITPAFPNCRRIRRGDKLGRVGEDGCGGESTTASHVRSVERGAALHQADGGRPVALAAVAPKGDWRGGAVVHRGRLATTQLCAIPPPPPSREQPPLGWNSTHWCHSCGCRVGGGISGIAGRLRGRLHGEEQPHKRRQQHRQQPPTAWTSGRRGTQERFGRRYLLEPIPDGAPLPMPAAAVPAAAALAVRVFHCPPPEPATKRAATPAGSITRASHEHSMRAITAAE